MDEKIREQVRDIIYNSNWNAYELDYKKERELVISGLYPLQRYERFKGGRVLYLPFVIDKCLIRVEL